MPRYQTGEYIILYFDKFGAKVGYEYAIALMQARDMASKYDAYSYAILRTIDNSVERGHKWDASSRMDVIGQNGNEGLHYDDEN